jgi:cell division protein FtsL
MAARRVSRGARGKRGGGRLRGRTVVGLLLLAFVLVTSGVVWRRSVGIAQARELRELDRRRAQLAAERTALESDVRTAASRARIAPIAETRLGMRVPADTQVVYLQRAGTVPPSARGDTGGRPP